MHADAAMIAKTQTASVRLVDTQHARLARLKVKWPLCFFIAIALMSSFVSGFWFSLSTYGDWIVLRDRGDCIAYDPGRQRTSLRWQPSDGICRLSGQLKKQVRHNITDLVRW